MGYRRDLGDRELNNRDANRRDLSGRDLKDFLISRNYVTPWIKLDYSDQDLFIANASIISVARRELLFRQGEMNDNIYIVRTGRFRIFLIDNTGREKCLFIAEKGSMIGEVSALDRKPNYASAYAIKNSTLFRIHIDDFMNICDMDSEMSLMAMKSLSYKIRLISSGRDYSTKSATVRVAAPLLALCARYGSEHRDGVRLTIRFTHEELANLADLNRVTVTRIFQKLVLENAISFDSGYLVVRRPDYLKGLIEGE